MRQPHIIIIAGTLLAVTWLATSRVVAQQASSTGVPVHMVVTVEPRHGSNVPVINREDVMVYQGAIGLKLRTGSRCKESTQDFSSSS